MANSSRRSFLSRLLAACTGLLGARAAAPNQAAPNQAAGAAAARPDSRPGRYLSGGSIVIRDERGVVLRRHDFWRVVELDCPVELPGHRPG